MLLFLILMFWSQLIYTATLCLLLKIVYTFQYKKMWYYSVNPQAWIIIYCTDLIGDGNLLTFASCRALLFQALILVHI